MRKKTGQYKGALSSQSSVGAVGAGICWGPPRSIQEVLHNCLPEDENGVTNPPASLLHCIRTAPWDVNSLAFPDVPKHKC